jgi:hypothetical protein
MTDKTKGLLLFVACALILVLASIGTTPEERDITPVLFLLPLGIHLVAKKESPYISHRGKYLIHELQP